MNWRFENTGFRSGVFNMEYDTALAQALLQGEADPTIRLFGWHPFTISLGWNQSLDAVDLDKTRSAGIEVIRRPTGGRAVLHSEELTYSVVMPVKEKNISAVYDEISRALLAGLQELGTPVSIERSQPYLPSVYKNHSSAACFSSAGRYEIKSKGKKLVGSAQRRFAAGNGREVVLQHGSILLGSYHKRIVDFLAFSSEQEREAMRYELDEKTTDLSTVLNRTVTYQETADAILLGFQKAWAIVPENKNLITEEMKVML